jgi:MOSC domain-containing protein YiiM
VPKLPVESAEVTVNGLIGDKQNNTELHGGPNRAVSLFSLDLIQALQAEGHPIAPGATGENLTLVGLPQADWATLEPGSRLKIGNAVEIEITSYVSPCYKLTDSFAGGDFSRISQKLHPGWSRLYAKVIRPGVVHPGDLVKRKV